MRIILPGLCVIYTTVVPLSALADRRLRVAEPLPVECDVDSLKVCNQHGVSHFRMLGAGELIWRDSMVWDLEETAEPDLGNVYPLPVRAAND